MVGWEDYSSNFHRFPEETSLLKRHSIFSQFFFWHDHFFFTRKATHTHTRLALRICVVLDTTSELLTLPFHFITRDSGEDRQDRLRRWVVRFVSVIRFSAIWLITLLGISPPSRHFWVDDFFRTSRLVGYVFSFPGGSFFSPSPKNPPYDDVGENDLGAAGSALRIRFEDPKIRWAIFRKVDF